MGTLHVEGDAAERFGEWLATSPSDFSLGIATKMEHGQWFALIPQFDITGAGTTEKAAVREVIELMLAYLHAYFEDGAPFEDAIRPIPRGLRLRITVESALAHLLRQLSVRGQLATESHYEMPPGILPELAGPAAQYC